MRKSYCVLFLIIFCTSVGSISCDCKKGNQRNNSSNSKTTTPPPPPQDSRNLGQAIQELEKEVANPNADLRLQGIYNIIRYLPPREFIQNADGSLSRINKEKNGRELFDKIVDHLEFNEAMNLSTSEAVAWLMSQDLLTPNGLNEQGSSPLEKAILAWMAVKSTSSTGETVVNTLVGQGAKLSPEKSSKLLEKLINDHFIKEAPEKHRQAIFDFLQKQGATLTPDKASILLEKLIESQLIETRSFQTLSDMADFLQAQGGTIPTANALTLLEKFIQKKQETSIWDTKEEREEKEKLQNYILDVLQQPSKGAIEPPKATDLLQQAVDKQQGPKVYKSLVQLGADPNAIQLKKDYTDKKLPLLHYAAMSSQEDYQELLKELVNSSKTNINVTGEHNFTVAMVEAYEHEYGNTNTVELLLARPELDLNNIKGDRLGVKDYTLLDMVVQDCMMIPGGNDYQQKKVVENNKRWLATLRKIKTHPNFKITPENIQNAQENYDKLTRGVTWSFYEKEALDTALEALNIIKNGPKQN